MMMLIAPAAAAENTAEKQGRAIEPRVSQVIGRVTRLIELRRDPVGLRRLAGNALLLDLPAAVRLEAGGPMSLLLLTVDHD
jgi:hypothetical protein